MLGLPVAHPFVAGASPLGRDLGTIRSLEDSGAAAIVLPSLFEEQVTLAAEGRIHHMDPCDERWAGYAPANFRAPIWVDVPEEKILPTERNPVVGDVVCFIPRMGVICFLPGRGT